MDKNCPKKSSQDIKSNLGHIYLLQHEHRVELKMNNMNQHISS